MAQAGAEAGRNSLQADHDAAGSDDGLTSGAGVSSDLAQGNQAGRGPVVVNGLVAGRQATGELAFWRGQLRKRGWTPPAWAAQLAWLLLLLVVWEGLARTGWYPPLLFPRMVDVLRSFGRELTGGELLARAGWSLGTISLGVLLAVGLALVTTVVALSCRPAQHLVRALLNVLHPLPGVALLPIFLLWFGMGSRAILAVVVFSCLWPLLGNLLAGLSSIPVTQVEAARNLGLRGPRLVWAVMIPASLPYALAGLRLSWARGWQTAVAAEMVFGAGGGDGGLGWFIYKRRFFLEVPAVFAGMLAIIAIGMLVEHGLFETLERHTTRRWGMTESISR